MGGDEELYDYYFSDDLVSKFSQRFNMMKAISGFISMAKEKTGKQIEVIARQVLGEYSRELSTSLVDSEKDRMDRGGEIIHQVAERTGIKFPSIPQRLIELGFMSTRAQDKLTISVSTPRTLTLRVSTCAAYTELESKFGEAIARDLPCKYGCLANSKMLFDKLNMPVEIEGCSNINEKGYCEFRFQSQE
jgi:hypothetical protein